MTAHLDEKLWAALLDGSLPAEKKGEVVAHLEGDCEACEDFLATAHERGGLDSIDGMIDDLLLDVAPAKAGTAGDDIGFQRVLRGMKQEKARTPWGLIAGGLIAACIAGVFVIPSEGPERLKGPAIENHVASLEVLSSTSDGVAALLPDARVVAGDVLVFRVRLETAGCVELWRATGDDPVRISDTTCLDAGEHVLSKDGEVLGLPLKDPGPLELELYSGPTKAIDRAVRADSHRVVVSLKKEVR